MNNNELLQKIEKLEQDMSELKNRNGGFRRYLGRAFRKTNVIAGIVITALIASAVLFAAQVTFQDNTIISAGDVNNNFNDLYASKWSRNGSNYFVTDGNVGIGTDTPGEKLEVNGNLKVTGKLMAGVWQVIHSAELTNANDYVISGLDGNSDKTYQITIQGLASGSSNWSIGVRPNGSTSSYSAGVQHFDAHRPGISYDNTTTGPVLANVLSLCNGLFSANEYFVSNSIINVQSGYARCINSNWSSVTQGSCGSSYCTGSGRISQCWLNTTDNITSLTLTFQNTTAFTGRIYVLTLR